MSHGHSHGAGRHACHGVGCGHVDAASGGGLEAAHRDDDPAEGDAGRPRAHLHGDHGHRRPHGHAPDHEHAHAMGAHGHGASLRRLGFSLVLTATIMIAEAVGGWVSGSLALLSDAGHMLTDAGALGLALAAAWLSGRPADDKRTFGYRRAEVLAAQINVGALLVLTVWIAWEAVDRLRGPPEPIRLGVMAVIAVVGLAANLAILGFLHGEQSLNARGAFLHVLSDTISSVAILIGAGVMALYPSLTWLDPVLSIAIALLILWGALGLILEITDILMEGVPRHIDAASVLRDMECCAGVVAVHDLHIWTISSGLYALSAHLVVHGEAMGRNDDILNEVKGGLRRRFGIDHTTLQIESAEYAHLNDYPH